VWVPSDPNRVEELPKVPDGASLILTIDRAVQAEIEHSGTEIEESGSEAGTIVVIGPSNGETGDGDHTSPGFE
jgi:cell division protein FtsI (penicillin-binding protein 3)